MCRRVQFVDESWNGKDHPEVYFTKTFRSIILKNIIKKRESKKFGSLFILVKLKIKEPFNLVPFILIKYQYLLM